MDNSSIISNDVIRVSLFFFDLLLLIDNLFLNVDSFYCVYFIYDFLFFFYDSIVIDLILLFFSYDEVLGVGVSSIISNVNIRGLFIFFLFLLVNDCFIDLFVNEDDFCMLVILGFLLFF